ncbi:fungal-specific transcription factor domain-containing protein [Xylariales sp. AK1849]|nr:fungal-specific transcription factor domain-containing protein [Xylariales sp. AK1849]
MACVSACVMCQHRKIKCDRNTPCSNCVKANVTCTPSTPAPARKRRRPNQDLQQRLARCEELLSEYATAKPSDESPEPSSIDEPFNSNAKLVVDDSGLRFTDSPFWSTLHNEVRAMREILDDDEKEEESYATPAEGQTPDHNTVLLLYESADSDLEDLHPEPAHVFRLWQTFLERANPLTKVIHVPSVQPLVVEAATNRANLAKNVEALLFSIYTMAAVALSEAECVALLGIPRDEAFNRFSKGVRVALMRIGILNKYDLVVLQALVLYLTSLSGRYDRHAAWILNGVIIRIAQKMGLHRDGTSLGLSPFDTEMRRRIWWQIILLDAGNALMSGLGQSLLPRYWDTKEPTNLNDADLFPTMSKIESKDGPTDMVFCLIHCEIGKLLMEYPGLESVILQNELAGQLSPTSSEVEGARRRIEELDFSIGEILRKYSDPSMGPVHELAAETRLMMVAKLRELVCPPRDQPEWAGEILTQKDNLFKISISTSEYSLKSYSQALKSGHFVWFVMSHFQVEVLIFMVGQLLSRTTGNLVERAWVVCEQYYHYHTELFRLSVKPNGSLAVFMLRAWRKREEFLRASRGSTPIKPIFISQLQDLLGSTDGEQDTTGDEVQPPVQSMEMMGLSNGNMDMPWDQMLGFVDTPAINWDMFGNAGQPAPNYANFGPGSENHPNLNSWI